MLAYPIDEAETLLSTKLKAAKTSLSNCEEDLDFLREQITVSSHGIQAVSETVVLICPRLWRWRLHECTTGMSFKSARRRRRINKRTHGKERGPRIHRQAEQIEQLQRIATSGQGSS